MELCKTIETVEFTKLLREYNQLSSKMSWLDNAWKGKQTGLQYAEGEDPFLSSTGSMYDKRAETEYSILNPLYKDTLFEEIIKKYGLVRTRFMWVSDKTCYSLHKDPAKRLHIPLVTNKDCYFVFPEKSEFLNLKPGFSYEVDTTQLHSFCNFSDNDRLHLVGVLK